MNDTDILNLYWQRNEAAIAASSAKYGAYCSAIARNILGGAQDAQECVNDTWLAAWNSIPPQRPALLKAYLGKLTRRISLKKWRDGRALKRGGGEIALALDELAECLPGRDGVETALETAALAELLNRFVAGLAPDERRVFLRRYWYLDSIREISALFGFSQGKVKSMLHRTRLKLMNRLKEEGIDL